MQKHIAMLTLSSELRSKPVLDFEQEMNQVNGRDAKKSGLFPIVFKILLGIVSTFVVIAYLSVEYYLQSSYRNMALGEYSEAAKNSARAAQMAQLLYPATSKHYHDIVLYDIKIWSNLGILGGSFGSGLKNITLVKTLEFERENKDALAREEMARIQIEGARIDNATTHGKGVALVYSLVGKSPSVDDIWSAYAREEKAYGHLTGSFATLTPKNADEQKRNDWVVELETNEHKAAQEKICTSDAVKCRFNDLRWKIGSCIRRAYLKQAPVCTPETLRDVTFFTGWDTCKDLTVDQCYSVMNDLLPYYHQFLQAQGVGILNLLALQSQYDMTFTNAVGNLPSGKQ